MNDSSTKYNISEPVLPAMLDEFRDALKDEIEVAKRNSSSSAIPLSNGTKIGQQGSLFHYAFVVQKWLLRKDYKIRFIGAALMMTVTRVVSASRILLMGC
ncbi:MAG TPA: hypothetical protein VJ904_06630 [Tichowtungia sp.]|nr:hypothetical protein [Tichowtungia sp.]